MVCQHHITTWFNICKIFTRAQAFLKKNVEHVYELLMMGAWQQIESVYTNMSWYQLGLKLDSIFLRNLFKISDVQDQRQRVIGVWENLLTTWFKIFKQHFHAIFRPKLRAYMYKHLVIYQVDNILVQPGQEFLRDLRTTWLNIVRIVENFLWKQAKCWWTHCDIWFTACFADALIVDLNHLFLYNGKQPERDFFLKVFPSYRYPSSHTWNLHS